MRQPALARFRRTALAVAAMQLVSPFFAEPTWAQALTPDRSVPGPHPVVGVAANGTPVVNINAPSAAGVSSNAFTNYNVGQAGVVLNNSGQNSQTQIAGWVQGNPFLGNNSARVILNQVTSGNPSVLAGPTEIAGNQASLIVANPAGITCVGCSFIQAPRVTLTTGTPNFDALGNISSISVQQGQITVNGAGLDARGAQLDLLSRAMAINGQVWAERINAVAGANSVDYGSVTPTTIAGVGPAPQVAIDVGQLGSMYGGGATRLIGTEQGLGVNIGGNLAALTGSLSLAANGDVTITPTGRVQSAADASLSAPNVNNQGVITGAGNVSVSGSTTNSGTLVAGANATVSGLQITNTGTIGAGVDGNGNLTQPGSVALNASGAVRNSGSVLASQNIGVVATSIDASNGSMSAQGALTLSSSGDVSTRNATLSANGVTVQAAGTLDNTAGKVSSTGALQVGAQRVVNQGGLLASNGDTAITTGSLDNTSGELGSNAGNLTVNSTGDIANANGKLIAAQDANISGTSLGNQAGTVSARNLTLNTGTGALDNTSGTISATGTANVTAGRLVNQQGTLAGAGNVSANVASLDNTAGVLGSSGGALNVASLGSVTNAGGKLLAAQDASITAASLGNQSGTVSGQNVTLNTGIGALDNTSGKVSAANTLQLDAGAVTNQGGTLAAVGDVHATVASLDNTAGGIVGSTQGNLTLTSTGNVANAGGKLLATQDIQLQAASLGNQAGTVSGRNVTVNTGTGALDNTGGAIASTAALNTTAGALANTNGVLQAGTTLTTQSQSLTNTSGNVIGNAVSVNAASLTNQQGTISSTTTLAVHGQTLSNDQGKMVSDGALTVTGGSLTNAGGQIASNSDVTVSGTTVDNSAGLMHAGGTLAVSGANLLNKNTNTATTGMEGANVALTATTSFDNTAGVIRSDQSTQITATSINNTQGSIQSAGTVGAKATAGLTNTQGNVNGTKSVGVTAAQMSGDGTVQSQGSVTLNLQSDYANTGTLAAGQDVSVTTTGNVTNSGTMSAGRNLAVSANNITNTQSGELVGVVSNTLTAQGTIANDGLIDGGATVVKANSVVNTGRLYGDTVAIGANVLTNTVNANGVAGVIASRGDMDLGVQTLNNQEHALIYAAGNMRIGGALDASNHATGSAQSVTNGSATINADGNLTIAANQINNQNNHFSTTDQTSPGTHVVSYRLNGSTQDIDPSTVRLFHRNNGGTSTADNWQWLGDDDYKVLLLPSSQYPFERYGPPFTYSNGTGGGGVGTAYIPEMPCSADSCTVTSYPEQFLYKTTDAIWGVFGIAAPAEIGTEPDLSTYPLNQYQQYQADHAAWQQRHDAAVTQYQALNDAINAFNSNLRGRLVDSFTIYDGTQQITRTVVTQSDPGMITSGGNMTLNAGVVNNVASQIVAGGDLTGSNVIGTRPNNVGMTGTQTVTTTGTASYTYIESGGAFSGDTRAYNTSPWQGQSIQTNFQLDVSPTNGTGPNSQPTVRSVAVSTKAGQGNGSSAATADRLTIGDTNLNLTSTTVTLPGNVVIRTVVPNLTLPNNALYRIISDPGSSVLVETDPRFTNFRQWTSSDAMLSQFRNDPGATLKRIGDGFYEQQLIQQQIIRATGQRFIGDYTSNEDEYKALLANGISAGKAFGLNVGTALTEAQMAQLTSDIVWMVKQTVTLADGSKQEVLVPQVYLRAKDTDITGGGTLMAGNNVSFNAKGDATNSGTIASRKVTVVTADNIVNTGTLAGSTLLAQATQDINNLGGHIQGDQVLLAAGRDVNLTSTTVQTKNITTTGTNIGQVASVNAGTLGIQADRDVNLTAAAISTSGDAGIVAGRDVNLSAARQSSEEHVVWGDKNRSDRSSYADVGTQIQTGGNLAIGAGQDVNATAAYANAMGSIQVAAGRDVNLNAGQSHQDVRDEHFQTEKGFLSSKTTHTIDSAAQTSAVGTTLSGDAVTVTTGRDLNVRGSNVAATKDVTLQALRDINIESTTSSTSESHYRKETQSGLLGSGGIGFMIGTRMQSEDDRNTQTTASASTIGSTNGNVSITAGNQYRQVGSNVIATQGDVDILAKKVEIQEAREQSRSSQESRFEQSGLTVAVTAPVIAALQTASQMGSAASETSDTRLKMLAGGATALAAKNAADAVAADPKSGGGASISITVGGSKSDSKQSQDADTAAGSIVRAGGDVRIRAIGDGQNSTLTVQGSDVQAGKNALLKADGDINLLAAKNTSDMERSSSSMSGGVGVAVSVSSNGASFGVTANASASRGEGIGHDVTWTNTHVNAGNQLALESGGDTNLKGAVVSGKQVVADVGGNLNMTSLQDTSTFHSKDQSIGGSVTVGYGFSGSVSASQQKIDSDYASVTEQSGIKAGDGGFQVNVRGNTDLKGAVIASTDKAVQGGLNSLTTATLTTSDIHNHADYNASSIGIGGGYSSSGSGVGTNQKGEATAGGDKVPGSSLPSAGGFSATPPVVMGASGSGSSTTISGVSGGSVHITDGAKQKTLTGKDTDQTVAGLNRSVSTDVDSTGALKPIFNEKEIKTGFEITGTFISQAGTFLNNRAQESTAAQKALDAEKAKPADQQDPTKIAQLTQTLQDNATWGMGGTGRMLLTALTAGAGANVTGGMGQLAQNATVAYLQALGANQVKQIADGLGSEDARAALHAIVGCAGAAASSQSCGAGAMGAASSSVIGSLLGPTDGMTPEQKQARENLVTSLVAGIAGATGVNATTATNAGQIEAENNQLVLGAQPRPLPPSPGQPQKPFQIPGFKGDTANKGDGVISDPMQQVDPTANIHVNPIGEQTGPKILVSPIDIVKSAIENVIAMASGWKRGDDVYQPTSNNNDPSWSAVRSRFWKNEAQAPDAAEKYGQENIDRMRSGLAPQRYNPDKGGLESMELSHEPVPARDGGKEFVPRWPQDHATVDPYRRPGY
ncbi:hemagglutinin repeat-containing protein [Ralstonia pseudosolanacearum]|uniref:hemagglutinin repeat-containing protein n=1 Tax=Ralstonia pseudosolanacearum TaxID=1310165 RepID=UPI0040544886